MIVAIAVPYELEIQIWLRYGVKGLGDQARIGKFEKLHGFLNVVTISAFLLIPRFKFNFLHLTHCYSNKMSKEYICLKDEVVHF